MREGVIRKLSVGKNFPDGAIHFIVGQHKKFNDKRYELVEIKEYEDEGVICHDIYLKDEFSIVKWKTLRGQIVAVEYLIDFE